MSIGEGKIEYFETNTSRIPMILKACITVAAFLSIYALSGQVLQFNHFELRSEEPSGQLSLKPDLASAVTKTIEQKLQTKLGIREFRYLHEDRFSEKPVAALFPFLKPKITGQAKADYYANVIYRFVWGGTTSTTNYTIQNVNFKLQVFVVNSKRKKVLKETVTIPAQVDAFASTIYDQWYSADDLVYLINESTNQLFSKGAEKAKRRVLTPGRSAELQAFLSGTDSLALIRGKKNKYQILDGDKEPQQLSFSYGSTNQEFTERFFNLDMSDRMKQKVRLENLTTSDSYDVVTSISAHENFHYSWNNDEDDAMVTFYHGERRISSLTLLDHRLIGTWGKDTLEIVELGDDHFEYRINKEKTGLCASLSVIKDGKKRKMTKFHFQKSLDPDQVQRFIYSYFAYDLAEKMEFKAREDEDS